MSNSFILQNYIPRYFFQAAFDIHPHLIEGEGYKPKFKDDGLPYEPNWKSVLQALICDKDAKLEKAWLQLSEMVNEQDAKDIGFSATRFGDELYRSLYRCFRGPSYIEQQPLDIRKGEARKILRHINELLLSIENSHLDVPVSCFDEKEGSIFPHLLLKHNIDEFEHIPGYRPKLSQLFRGYKEFIEGYDSKLGTQKYVTNNTDRINDAIRVLFSVMMRNFSYSKPFIIRTFTSKIMQSVLGQDAPFEISNEQYNDAVKIFRKNPNRLIPIT